jgi:hypothetical protein
VVQSAHTDPTVAAGPAPESPSTVLHYMDPELEQLAGIRGRSSTSAAGPLDAKSHERMLEIEKHLGAPQATPEEAHRAGQDAEWLNTKADAAEQRAKATGDAVHIANAERARRTADDAAAKAEELAGKVDKSPVSFDDVRMIAKEGNQRVKNWSKIDPAAAADKAAAGTIAEGSRRLDPRANDHRLGEGPWANDAPVNFGEALDRYGAGQRANSDIVENFYGAEGSRPPDGLSKEEFARRKLAKVGTASDPLAEERIATVEKKDPQSRGLIDRLRLRNTEERRQLSGALPYSLSTLGVGKWLMHEGSNLNFKLRPPHVDAQGQAYTPQKGAAMQGIPLELQMLLMHNRRQEEGP